MNRDGSGPVSTALRIVFGCVALAGCGREAPAAPVSKAPAAGLAATTAPETTPAPQPPSPAPPVPPAPAAAARPVAQERRADVRSRPSVDPYSVLDVEISAPKPFVLKLRVEPELAPDLASAKLKLEQPTFTVAGRPIDVSGGRLSVCGIGLGPIEDRSVLTLQRGEVRVDDVYRGPLPAAVETH
jgi:hypothetical protein